MRWHELTPAQKKRRLVRWGNATELLRLGGDPPLEARAAPLRTLAGIAYWFHPLQGVQSALMADYDSLERTGITPSVPRATNYALHMLINF